MKLMYEKTFVKAHFVCSAFTSKCYNIQKKYLNISKEAAFIYFICVVASNG